MAGEFTKSTTIKPAVIGAIANPDEYNQNIAGQSKGAIVPIDVDGNFADGDVGDETLGTNGTLINNIKLREGGTLKFYNASGVFQNDVNLGQGTQSLIGQTYLYDPISFSNNSTDSDHDIDITTGVFDFDDGSGQGKLTSALIKQIDANFVAGTNQGGLEDPETLTGTYTTSGTTVTGSSSLFTSEFSVGDVLGSSGKSEGRRITAIASDTSMTIASAFSTDVSVAESVKKSGWVAPSTTYHIFSIYNPTSILGDVLFSSSLSDPNLPSGYTKKKREGSVITNSSANILGFTMTRLSKTAVQFIFDTVQTAFGGATPGFATTLTVNTPLGLETGALFSGVMGHSGAACWYKMGSKVEGGAIYAGAIGNIAGARSHISPGMPIKTNTSSQINHGSDGSLGPCSIVLYLHGWIDYQL